MKEGRKEKEEKSKGKKREEKKRMRARDAKKLSLHHLGIRSTDKGFSFNLTDVGIFIPTSPASCPGGSSDFLGFNFLPGLAPTFHLISQKLCSLTVCQTSFLYLKPDFPGRIFSTSLGCFYGSMPPSRAVHSHFILPGGGSGACPQSQHSGG